MKRLPTLAVVLFAAGSLAACGSGTTTTAAPSASQAVSTPAAAPTSAAPLDGQALAKRMSDAFVAAKSGSMTMTMKSTGATSAAGATTVTMKSQFQMTSSGTMDTKVVMDMSGMSIEAVLTGGMMYMKMPGLKSKDGKPWIKIDPNGTDPLSKQVGGQLKAAGDPRAQVEQYKDAKVTLVGTSGGVSQYKLSGVAGAGEMMLWVDDATGRPTKTTVDVSGVQAIGEFSGWGQPVDIAVPPADQVGPPPGS